MKRWSWLFVLGLVALFAAGGTGVVEGGDEHAYIGADKCKMCHNSESKGAQYTKWSQGPHAKAFETLASPEAKKIAADKGIGDPQKADECLQCHVTGHGAPAEILTDKYNAAQGVTCEACHGPGGDYWKMTVMKDREQAVAAGLLIPDEKTCRTCHNDKSPTFKDFDWAAYSARIAHDNPLTP